MTIRDIIGFDWDQANREKSWLRHAIKWSESEQVFFNEPIFVFPDVTHSASEDRFHALGKTNVGKLLFICFTFRGSSIRIISARPMSRLERKHYENT